MALVPPPQAYYDRWGHQVWVDPNNPADAYCTHHPNLPPGHTTLYIIHDMHSEDVLYVGITGNVPRRFRQHKAKKPWWKESELAHLECYDSWESAAEAELSRIETYRPRHNIVGNKRVEPPRDPALIDCIYCGFAIQSGTEEYEDSVGSRWPQHNRCGISIVEAYEMGVASMLPSDDPWAVAVRRRYSEAH